jgi:hypothetical protein
MNFLKTHKAWIIHLIAVAVLWLEPSVHAWMADPAHSIYAAPVGAVWGLALVWARSPKDSNPGSKF